MAADVRLCPPKVHVLGTQTLRAVFEVGISERRLALDEVMRVHLN